MKKSIESIWKEGFSNEGTLVAPKINDLYNQRSKHLVERMKRVFRINLAATIIMAILFPFLHYFLGAVWQGAAASVLLLLTAWYGKKQMQGIKTLDQGATSFDYLRSFHRWLKDVFRRSKKIARYTYPLYFLIAASTIGSAWSQRDDLVLETRQKFPGMTFIGDIPLAALVIAGLTTLLMFYFSDKIYKWDVRLVYGSIFSKLEQTIAEMEALQNRDDND